MTTELTKAAQQALEQLEFMNACYPHKTAADAIAALQSALTQRPAAQTERDTGPRVLREVFALCEDTIDKMAGENTEFSRGRAFEAKGISRAIGTWFQDEYCGRSYMGEPSLPAPQQATPDVPETDFGNMATQQAAGEPVAALVRTRSLITRAEIAADGKDHFSEWGPWEPQTLSYAKAVTAPDRNAHPKLYEMAPLFTHPAPGVPEGWRDAKNDPPPVGVDVLVAAEFDGPGDWRIKVGGRNPEQRTGWWVFGASWVPQVWMPLDAHRAMLAAAQAKGGE